jgi:hypothetical protein
MVNLVTIFFVLISKVVNILYSQAKNIFLNKSHVNITIIKRNFIKLRLTFYFARKKKLKVYKNIDQNYSLIFALG